MNHKVKQEADGSYTFSFNMQFEGSMLEMEDQIEEMVNQLGLAATLKALSSHDTSGEDLLKGKEKLTSKGSVKKNTTRPME